MKRWLYEYYRNGEDKNTIILAFPLARIEAGIAKSM
jgi:hypothetical protein